ncbi:MAG: hypothetical protein A4E53_04092 [Pelotomaculum sp. PtaB.Bin104]|nr:MAG: hypothetical protein A4E53_04092 [Pelotomaculum sp. PtaB.Bin104]
MISRQNRLLRKKIFRSLHTFIRVFFIYADETYPIKNTIIKIYPGTFKHTLIKTKEELFMIVVSAVLSGLMAGIFLFLLFHLAVPQASFLAFWLGWTIFSLLFYQNASSTKIIWSRACITTAMECLAIPQVSWLLSIFNGQQAVQTAKPIAHLEGLDFGSAFGSCLVNVLSGSAGVLIGLLLLFIAHYALQPARRKR